MNTFTNSQGTATEPELFYFVPSDYAYQVVFADADGITSTREGELTKSPIPQRCQEARPSSLQ